MDHASTPILGHGLQEKYPSVLLQDFVTNSVQVDSPSSSTSPSTASTHTPYPITHYINCANYFVNYRKFLLVVVVVVVTNTELGSFKEAMCDVRWKESMQDEIMALKDNGTWTLETLAYLLVRNLWRVNGCIVSNIW